MTPVCRESEKLLINAHLNGDVRFVVDQHEYERPVKGDGVPGRFRSRYILRGAVGVDAVFIN